MAIQDVDDLIRQLHQHPEWRDALRRELLTDELLSLPQIVRELTAQMRELAEFQRRHYEEFVSFRAETERHFQELAEALKRTDQHVEELADAQLRTDGRVGSIDGRLFEREYIDKAYAYFDDLLRKIQMVPWSEVAGLLDKAEERISRQERKQVMETDLILHGRRRSDMVETYLLGEVSIGIGLEDVHRASQRAKILSRATEKPVISVVGGKRIIPEARELAKELGVSVFLDGGMQAE